MRWAIGGVTYAGALIGIAGYMLKQWGEIRTEDLSELFVGTLMAGLLGLILSGSFDDASPAVALTIAGVAGIGAGVLVAWYAYNH